MRNSNPPAIHDVNPWIIPLSELWERNHQPFLRAKKDCEIIRRASLRFRAILVGFKWFSSLPRSRSEFVSFLVMWWARALSDDTALIWLSRTAHGWWVLPASGTEIKAAFGGDRPLNCWIIKEQSFKGKFTRDDAWLYLALWGVAQKNQSEHAKVTHTKADYLCQLKAQKLLSHLPSNSLTFDWKSMQNEWSYLGEEAYEMMTVIDCNGF
jgi:hypothetical protein